MHYCACVHIRCVYVLMSECVCVCEEAVVR